MGSARPMDDVPRLKAISGEAVDARIRELVDFMLKRWFKHLHDVLRLGGFDVFLDILIKRFRNLRHVTRESQDVC